MLATNIDFSVLRQLEIFKSPSYLAGIVAGLLAVYCVGRIIYNLYFHPLAKFPGPKTYAATHIPQCWLWLNGTEHLALRKLHEKYGDVVRITPDGLSYTGSQAWKDIYGYRPGTKQIPKDEMFYKRTGREHIPDIIFSNDADHSRIRRTLSNAFSDKALRGSEPILYHYFDQLISSLKERASSPDTSVVDMSAWYNWTTFDIIGDLAFGESFHCLDNAAYHPYISSMMAGIYVSRFFRTARIYWSERIVFSLLRVMSKFDFRARKAVNSLMRSYASDVLAKRLSPDRKMQERQDFMYHILRQQESKGLSQEELEMTSAILIIAGSETTATFLSGTTYLLLKNPDALQSLVNEVRNRFKSEDEITLSSTIAQEMPYLHAVIEEGLRVYPPVPTRLPRRVDKGIMIKGEYIEPGTAVGVHQWSSTRDENNFHNAEKFVPERWLSTPPPEYENDDLDGNQPFSTGPRNCLGKNLAYGEMRSILAKVIFNFDLELAEKEAPGKEWNNQKIYALWVKPPLMVKLKLREGL